MKYLPIFVLIMITTQLIGQEMRIVKGFVTDKSGEIYIGATVALSLIHI